MKVQLIRNEGCHIWEKAQEELELALREVGLPSEYEVIVVKNNEEAAKYRFFGSPQITLDGHDLDPSTYNFNQYQAFGCRIYTWQGKMYEYPPKEMIVEKLKSQT